MTSPAAISFTVPGKPQGKGRARAARRGDYVTIYTPEKTVAYEGLIALAGEKAMNGRALVEGPVQLTITAVFSIPKGWSQKKRTSRPIHWHTSRCDLDNVVKAVGDGLNGIVWRDDSQVAMVKAIKLYGDTPGLTVVVEALA